MRRGENYSPDMIDLLGLRVTADFQNKIENNRISVEGYPGQCGRMY